MIVSDTVDSFILVNTFFCGLNEDIFYLSYLEQTKTEGGGA